VGKRAVDRGESNVGHLVQLAQPLHRHIADRRGRYLLLVQRHQRGLDIVGEAFEVLRRDRAAVAGCPHPAHQLLAVVRLALAILLDHREADRLDPLVRREALAARRALTPAADGLTAVELPGVDHITVWMLAEWTTHGEAISAPHPN